MSEKEKPTGNDFVAFGPDLGDGSRPYIRHREDHTIEQGLSRPVQPGQPVIDGSVVRLTPRESSDLFDVETMYESPRGEGKGPAKVATRAYRSGCDAIFGGKTQVGQA